MDNRQTILHIILCLILACSADNVLANEQASELDVDEPTTQPAQAGAEQVDTAASAPGSGQDEETDLETSAESEADEAPGSAVDAPDYGEPEPGSDSAAGGATETPDSDPSDAAAPSETGLEPELNPAAPDAPEDPGTADQPPAWGPLDLFEKTIHPGEKRRITWYPDQSALGLSVPTPVLVARGDREGPALCLTAAIHGDELNGVEMIRRLLLDVDPEELQGTIIGIPIVNTFGFIRSSRYLPDRRDLNRYFPGSSGGSSASRLAAALFNQLKVHCNLLVDIHTGSFHRTNLPQLRADLSVPEVVELTRDFGATPVLRSRAPRGSLRQAAVNAGIPSVTFEAGEPLRFQPEEVAHGVKALESLLRNRKMVSRFSLWNAPQPVFYESSWVRSDGGGILLTRVDLGDVVEADELLATVTDPINNTVQELRAPFAGRVLGMALNQVVLPGFAAIHLGRATSEQEAVSSAQADEPDDAELEDEGLDPEDPDAPAPDTDNDATDQGASSDEAETASSTPLEPDDATTAQSGEVAHAVRDNDQNSTVESSSQDAEMNDSAVPPQAEDPENSEAEGDTSAPAEDATPDQAGPGAR